MRSSRLVVILLVFAMPASLAAVAQEPVNLPDITLDDAARTAVIDGLLKKIGSVYVFPELARKMEHAIRERQGKKEYSSITSGREFARILTEHLREICKDGHLHVELSVTTIAPDSDQKPPAAKDVRQFRESGRQRNYQFKKVELLDGGIGLLQVDGFYPGEWVSETAAASMSFLANSEAVILDLRRNSGGAPTGVVLLCSYFFDEETRLSDHFNRAEDMTRQYWTYAVVPGSKLADKDLYILTSRKTFSAPESLAYDLQVLKRATIVGEATGGGAHGTTLHRITDHFRASIPFSRSINPVTKTDWEGSGVKPDVAVPADQALLTAHLLALRKALTKHASEPKLVEGLRHAISEKESELQAIKKESNKP